MKKAPILYCIFNRLDVVKETFKPIAQYKPEKLYIASDGHRKNVVNEKEQVDSVRNYVLSNINWECDVKTLFRDENLGCDTAIPDAVTWFFKHEQMGIILEDDIKASSDFFDFCTTLLERYKDNESIVNIQGTCASKEPVSQDDYVFMHRSGTWGWATWARCWKNIDFNMSDWPSVRNTSLLFNVFQNEFMAAYWTKIFDDWYYTHNHITWDFAYSYHNFKKVLSGCISISPSNKNLVTNIGYSGVHFNNDENSKHLGWNIDTLNSSSMVHPKTCCIDYNLTNKIYNKIALNCAKKYSEKFNKPLKIKLLENFIKYCILKLKSVFANKKNIIRVNRLKRKIVEIQDDTVLLKLYINMLKSAKKIGTLAD